MDHEANPKKSVIEYIADLCIIECPWESAFCEEKEDAKGNDNILPSEEDEKIR